MELDDAYANGAYISGAAEFPPRWNASAEDFRNSLKARAQLDLPYGEGARQRFDLFLPEGEAKGLLVFVHGGYWLQFDKSTWSHLANGPVCNGWAVAVPSYDLCPDVRIAEITRQIARSIVTASQQIDGPIVLAGHSAGGHLVARMLDPEILPAEVAERLKLVLPISPLADLIPLLRTTMNKKFGMTSKEAKAESPVEMQSRYHVDVTVWVGSEERPAFLDQAQWLADAWAADHVIAFGKHHFNVIDPLHDPDSDMVALITS